MKIAIYESHKSVSPVNREITWGGLKDLLSSVKYTTCYPHPCTGHACSEKKRTAWSPVEIHGQRLDSNVKFVTALVLDLDNLSEEALSQAGEKLQPYTYIAHSTHADRHDGKRSLRVVLKLSEPVAEPEWRGFYKEAITQLGVPADPTCKNTSRIYFLPSRPTGAEFDFEENQGVEFPVGSIIGAVKAKSSPLGRAAKWLGDHGPAVQGSRGDEHTYQACAYLINDMDLPFEDAWPLLKAWNAGNKPPWDEDELIQKLRNAEKYATAEPGRARKLMTLEEKLQKDPSPVTEDEMYGTKLAEFIGKDEPEEDKESWLVNGVLPAGVPVIISGPPKSSKTFVSEHLALSVASGKTWLGKFSTRQGKVLLIPREDTPRETKRRLWRLARGLSIDMVAISDQLRVEADKPFRFDDEEDLRRMKATLEAWRPDLVIIDPLAETHHQDENNAASMKRVIDAWADMSRTYKTTIAVLHHWKKPSLDSASRGVGAKLRGTSALFARVRHVVGVERRQGLVRLEMEGNLPGLPEPFNIEITDGLCDDKPCIKIVWRGKDLK